MTINWLLFLGNKTTICKQQWNMKKLKRNKDIDKSQQHTLNSEGAELLIRLQGTKAISLKR